MTSKGKKRVVLPTRPEPPTAAQIQEDIEKASPTDPVFTVLKDATEEMPFATSTPNVDSELERKYQQSRRYYDLNEKLLQMRGEVAAKRQELQEAGRRLEESTVDIKEKSL
ncbi:UPF0449 protein C19orf25 homolog [Polypterus senegalus]|uniref:UPF0449 protein C19orf25 homolog n=1 Tax=Polypterus senegalus TaxID=55291 RepID=UPI0019625FEF|nr:UPF0449 protein C19orf25 homolog [Polypterus senegalus]XP_039623054.1 UPF0449 protein C19orf25 homolog [Polypterus senegalus]